jgi:hypothetical protein
VIDFIVEKAEFSAILLGSNSIDESGFLKEISTKEERNNAK